MDATESLLRDLSHLNRLLAQRLSKIEGVNRALLEAEQLLAERQELLAQGIQALSNTFGEFFTLLTKEKEQDNGTNV